MHFNRFLSLETELLEFPTKFWVLPYFFPSKVVSRQQASTLLPVCTMQLMWFYLPVISIPGEVYMSRKSLHVIMLRHVY